MDQDTPARRTVLAMAAGSLSLGASGCGQPPVGPARMNIEDFQPKSMLVVPETRVARARFPVIDVHTHVSAVPQLAQILKWMDELNVRTLVNVTGGTGEALRANIAALQNRHKGRFLVCTEPSYGKFPEPGYSKWQAEELERAKQAGAVGLKVLKTLGLVLREKGKEGPLVHVDDARLDPMWDAAGELQLPVFIHTSDPDAFFTPIDRYNERWEELGGHPDWSFHGRDYPSKQELLAQRNRVIERHRKTTFVGLHVANHPENLDDVSAWLDRYPNLHVEIGARIGELGRQPRRARQFFDKYQDRIMFGTDAVPNIKEMVSQDFTPQLYHGYFRFLETPDEYFDYAPMPTPPQGRWKIYGLGLPDSILKKVYTNNAARLLGVGALV
jgi:predicted TIM-barrel fold metal-dependent hydrolase